MLGQDWDFLGVSNFVLIQQASQGRHKWAIKTQKLKKRLQSVKYSILQ